MNARQQNLNSTIMRLGGSIALDGQASWAPIKPNRFQPISCYLLKKPQAHVLIDTGVAAHQSSVVPAVARELEGTNYLIACLTRSEPECAGNLLAIHEKVPVNELVTATVANPFDDYSSLVAQSVKLTTFPFGAPASFSVGEPPILEMFLAQFRMLLTVWFFDEDTGTLFSSDVFGHTDLGSSDAPPIITSSTTDRTTYESAREHILAKFWWIPKAGTQPLCDWLKKIFAERRIETIAPAHGCVLMGRDVIDRHLNLVLEVLEKEGLQ